VRQLSGDSQHLVVDLAQLGDQCFIGGYRGPLSLGEVWACFPPVGLILEQVQVGGLVVVHLDGPGHGGVVEEIGPGPGGLEEFQLLAHLSGHSARRQ
jgi:hypothetical protein